MDAVISKIRQIALTFGPTTAILLISQAISAVSLSLLPLLGLRVSDIYAVAVQTGTGPYNGFVLGVVYLVVIGRPSFCRWGIVNISVGLFSVGLTSYSLFSVLNRGGHAALSTHYTSLIVMLFGAGGLALGVASVSGVRQACLGRPWLLAGVTMIPNAFMATTTLISVVYFHHYAGTAVAPAFAWFCAAVCTMLVFWLLPLPQLTTARSSSQPETRNNKIFHIFGLLIGLITSTVFPIGFVTAAGKLNAGSATILFLINRIGGAIVGIFVNAVLMVKINWESPESASSKSSAIFPAASVGFALVGIVTHLLHMPNVFSYVIIAAGWLLLTCSTPIILREANVRRLGSVLLIKGFVDLILTGIALKQFQYYPSFTGYFAASMISQQVTCIVCGTALKNRPVVIATSVGLVFSVLLLGWGW